LRQAAIAIVITFLALAGALEAAVAKPTVSAVRMGVHPDKTRFVLELDAAPAYRIFTLPDPYRVVIDLPEINWTPPKEATGQGVGVVEAMRFGLFAPGTSRVVLDVRKPVAIQKAFVLPPKGQYPHRLVIDMARVDRATFLASRARQPITSDRKLPAARPVKPELKMTKPGDTRPTIVIDPGHGGVDPGAVGISGIYEKDLVMDYAFELKRQLEATGRFNVAMTRDKDIFIRLRDRIAIAQQYGGDLFVSLHANTHSSRKIRGASVYTLSETSSDAEAAALAAKENKADVIAGMDLSDKPEVVSQILIDLAQRETMNTSKIFANDLVSELGEVTKLLRNTHRFAGFAVLKSPNIPSVLVEIGYMTNPQEERMLGTPAHRAKVVRALVRAIENHFEQQQVYNRS